VTPPAPPPASSYDSSGAWTIGRAARALATACARGPRPLPAVGAVVLGPQSVLFHLTTPDEKPPPGWSFDDAGRTWWTTLEQVTRAPVDGGLPEPFPRLVSLGTTGAGRMLLNLERADGVISLDGHPGRIHELARTWALRLTASPWSSGLRVVRVGFGPEPGRGFAGLDVAHLAEATRLLEGPDSGVLILAQNPQGRDRDYVDWLTGDRRRRWSVVAIEATHARWRLTVDVGGTITSALLDEPALLRA
jgi:hypothetical protein